MPNLNAPAGLVPVSYRDGSAWNGQARLYAIAASITDPFSIGDVVKMDATNFATTSGVPYVIRATAAAAARGVIVGVGTQNSVIAPAGPYINPNNLSVIQRPSGAQSGIYYALVVDDPNVIFEVQEDTSASPAVANFTKNANIAFANPTAPNQLSAFQLSATSYGTGATLNLKVMGAVQRPDNQILAAYQKLLVCINNHDFSGGTAGY